MKAILRVLAILLLTTPLFAEVIYDHKEIPWDFKPGQKVTMKADPRPDEIFVKWIGVKCMEGSQKGETCTFITPKKKIAPGAVYHNKRIAGKGLNM